MDKISREARSRIMAAVHGKDTGPEMRIRRGLHALGFRYRVHVKTLPGKPDIVLARYRAVILINGCFWHLHGCKRSTIPEEKRQFWETKLKGNKERDERNVRSLLGSGWRVLVIWECAFGKKGTHEIPDLLAETSDWIRSENTYGEIPPFPE